MQYMCKDEDIECRKDNDGNVQIRALDVNGNVILRMAMDRATYDKIGACFND